MQNIVVRYDDEVVAFIERLDDHAKMRTLRIIDLLERYDHALRMPYSKPIGSGLIELRVIGGISICIFYTHHDGCAILLHAIIKKTDRTPRAELEKAFHKMRSRQI